MHISAVDQVGNPVNATVYSAVITALVAFIISLNVTIATGSIHGLIFYANILAANEFAKQHSYHKIIF